MFRRALAKLATAALALLFVLSQAPISLPSSISRAASASACCCKGRVCHCEMLGGKACGVKAPTKNVAHALEAQGQPAEAQWATCPTPENNLRLPEAGLRGLQAPEIKLDFLGRISAQSPSAFILPPSSIIFPSSPPPEFA